MRLPSAMSSACGLVGEPFRVIGGRITTMSPSMRGMLGAAILRAEQAENAGLGGVEPDLGIASRQHVLLDAESRDEERVDDVLGGHHQPDRLADGNMQALISRAPLGCWVFHIHCLATTWISIALLGRISAESRRGAVHQKRKRNRKKVAEVQPISNSRVDPFRQDVALCAGAAAVAQRKHHDKAEHRDDDGAGQRQQSREDQIGLRRQG